MMTLPSYIFAAHARPTYVIALQTDIQYSVIISQKKSSQIKKKKKQKQN